VLPKHLVRPRLPARPRSPEAAGSGRGERELPRYVCVHSAIRLRGTRRL